MLQPRLTPPLHAALLLPSREPSLPPSLPPIGAPNSEVEVHDIVLRARPQDVHPLQHVQQMVPKVDAEVAHPRTAQQLHAPWLFHAAASEAIEQLSLNRLCGREKECGDMGRGLCKTINQSASQPVSQAASQPGRRGQAASAPPPYPQPATSYCSPYPCCPHKDHTTTTLPHSPPPLPTTSTHPHYPPTRW